MNHSNELGKDGPPSVVHRIVDAAPLFEAFRALDTTTYVVFDVDQVLLDPVDWVLSGYGGPTKFRYFEDIIERLGQERFDYLYSLIVKHRRMQPLDAKLPEAIRGLQRRGIHTLALTAFWDGPYGCIDDMSAHRVAELRANGYDFSADKPARDHLFTSLVSARLNRHPRLREGVITTSHLSKGQTLVAYLDAFNLKPGKILFIDDNAAYMKDVRHSCAEAGIPFEGFHLVQSSPTGLSPSPRQRQIAAVQFHFLEHFQRWLDDDQAAASLVGFTA